MGIFFSNNAESKDQEQKKSYSLSGYLQTEMVYDTYQSFGSVDLFNIWYPLPPLYDPLGNNSNEHGQFDIYVVESRIQGQLKGPNIQQFSSKATVEVDIAGRNEVLNLVRLRHAFYEIYDNHWNFTFGHTWHPLYTKPYVPTVISNNSGNPFETYARKPQIRISYSNKSLVNIFALLAEDDHLSTGPLGNSSLYIRNGLTPEMSYVFQWINDNGISVGGGLRFKRIRPRILTENSISVDESINSVIGMVYGGFETEQWHVASRFIYAQNGSDLNMLGGYAVRTVDGTTDRRTYTTIDVFSWWFDCIYKGFKQFEIGCYGAYLHNLGAHSTVNVLVSNYLYGPGAQVKNLFRVSPLLTYQIEDFKIAFELECTFASHGLMQADGTLKKNDKSKNIRFLSALFYFF